MTSREATTSSPLRPRGTNIRPWWSRAPARARRRPPRVCSPISYGPRGACSRRSRSARGFCTMSPMLSDAIREMVERIDAAEEAARNVVSGEGISEANRIVSKAAGFYEKLRYLIDYREEHTIRRAALERILKRRVFIEQKAESGLVLLQELVDGKYIAKEQATEDAARDIDIIIGKYLELRRVASANGVVGKRLVSFAATEIDARLSPLEYAIDHEVVEAFFRTMRGHVSVPGFSEEDINIQLYAACWRALLAADNDRLAYALC